MEPFHHDEGLVILKLLIAHILGDFVLQPDKWIADKKEKGLKSSAYYKHLAIVAGLTFIVIGQLNMLGVGVSLFITTTHGIIDFWKIKVDKNGSLLYFLADQFLHVIILLISWLFLINGFDKAVVVIASLWNSFPIVLIGLGYLFCVVPSSFIVKLATMQMMTQDHDGNVKRGGRLIGIFERLIIFTFVLFNQYEAIGFLITGKSILRFADGQKKETEYVLVGTMISYTLAILAGVLVNFLRQATYLSG